MSIEIDFYNYRKMIDEALETVDINILEQIKNVIVDFAKKGCPLLVCGNGGSAAISEHLSCDHTKGICMDTSLSPFVVSLGSNVSMITAIANDISYENVFSKQIDWFNDNAGLLVISSSGNSPNIIAALEAAKRKKMITMALVGFNGGRAKQIADLCLHVNYNNYGIVEDCHQILMHCLAQNIRSSYAIDKKNIKL